MTAKQFRAALDRLGQTQMGWARVTGRNGRTVRKWIGGHSRVPPEVTILLRLLLAGKITVSDIDAARSR